MKYPEILNVQSFLFAEISKIDILYQKIIENVISKYNSNSVNDYIQSVYLHFIKPIFEKINSSLTND